MSQRRATGTFTIVAIHDGVDGTIYQRIYKSTNSPTEATPSGDSPAGWSTTPTAITTTARYRHMSERHSDDGGKTWGDGWSTPQIDAYLSEDGTSVNIKGEAVGVLTWGQADKGSGDPGNYGDIWLKNNDSSPCDYLRYETPAAGAAMTWVGRSDAVIGDGYLIDGYLWMMVEETATQTTPRWKNVGNIQGPKGDDAWSVQASQSPLIINQSRSNTSDFGLPIEITFSGMKGNNAATVGNVTATNSMGFQITGGAGKITINSYSKVSGSYVTSGTIQCTVPLTYNGVTQIMTVGISVGVNLLGEFKREIDQDIETAMVDAHIYEIDPDTGEIIESSYLYKEVNSAVESITTMSAKINSGKNLLSGVLTGTGWKSAMRNVQTQQIVFTSLKVEDYWFIKGDFTTFVASPLVGVTEGETYTLSFDAEGTTAVTVIMYISSTTSETLQTTAASRRSVTFESGYTGNVRFLFQVAKIRFPQLETGDAATEFEATTTETSSQIKQTAGEILAQVEETGVDITDGKIKLFGGKVEIEDSVYVPTVLSENDQMFTQISAGRLEIRSKTTQSYGLFEINGLGEIILTMFDKDGNCVINLGGTPNAMVNGEWITWKLCAKEPGHTSDGKTYYAVGESDCTPYYQLKLGQVLNTNTVPQVLQYYLPPVQGASQGVETRDDDVKARNNWMFKEVVSAASVQSLEDGIKAKSLPGDFIPDGYYVLLNNGRFDVVANQYGPTGYKINIYHFVNGKLAEPNDIITQQFSYT